MGGTFDRLHVGHESDLKTAFESGERVTIGLTTEALLTRKQFKETIQSYQERKTELSSYINIQWPNIECEIIAIDDPYGPAIDDSTMDALVVTKETFKNGEVINSIRVREGLETLTILEAPWILAADGQNVSSTRIRAGEIDRKGFVYSSLFQSLLRLPNSLRDEFKKPTGELLRGEESNYATAAQKTKAMITKLNPPLVISVGDIVTQSLIESGFTPHVSIIDYKTQRNNLAPSDKHITYDGVNAAGTINPEVVTLIARATARALTNHQFTQIVIDGEEDLLVPPAILLSPLNSVVIYGQANEGMVLTHITEQMKEYIRGLVGQLESEIVI